MNDFRTAFSIPKAEPFGYDDRVMLCGSCFVENIGKKLKDARFNVLINPFGILFNSGSLAKSLEDIMDNKPFTEDELVFHRNLYHSFSHHSRFAHHDATVCVKQINSATTNAHHYLKKTKYLILTLGTAWVYRYRHTGTIVSACHKIPQREFDRELLSVAQITEMLSAMIQRLSEFNPDIRTLLTISPVRHIKDGFVGNQQSKAALILSVKQLTERFENCSYFPVYELFMDDLRDYRFYAADMLHPSKTAIQYIWERFCETFFEQKTLQTIYEAEQLYTASQHRPFNTSSDEYQEFQRIYREKEQQFVSRFPNARMENTDDTDLTD